MLETYKRLVGELGLANKGKSLSDFPLDYGVGIAPQYDPERLLQLACSRPSSSRDSRVVLVGEIKDRFDALGTKVHEAHLEVALSAIAAVERERFVPPEYAGFAYLPMNGDIGFGQTISNPHVVAAMVAAAEPDPQSVVLEVGTGCGYQAAVLSHAFKEVVSIEIVPELAVDARARLAMLGYGNVVVMSGDGGCGFADGAPFDAIVVAAGAKTVPTALLAQLSPNGRLVVPIGPTVDQEELIVVTNGPDCFERRSLGQVRFVPLTGSFGRMNAAAQTTS